MKYYINPETNKIYAFEDDGSQDHLIKDDYRSIAESEISFYNANQITLQMENMPYTEQRKKAYPPIEDYLDGIVKGDMGQVQAYIDACLAVKQKYPKV